MRRRSRDTARTYQPVRLMSNPAGNFPRGFAVREQNFSRTRKVPARSLIFKSRGSDSLAAPNEPKILGVLA
jgi:hypothetical protein